MPATTALEKLREQLSCLEEAQRRFSHTIPVTDAVDRWIPHGGLPTGCIHEVKGAGYASALAFCSILSARIAGDQGNLVYIAPDRSFYPLGLLPYGVNLNQVLLVFVRQAQNLSKAVLEALRCPQVSAVLAKLDGVDLTASRRLQLAAESSRATGFLLGNANSAPIAAPTTRWKVSSHAGKPGQRFDEPVWALDLLYCRGGRPGSWTVEWRNGRLNAAFDHLAKPPITTQVAREALAG